MTQNQNAEEKKLVRVELTEVQNGIFEQLKNVENKYMHNACENTIGRKIFKQLPLDVRKQLIMLTPPPRFFNFEQGSFTPTAKERIQKQLGGEQSGDNIVQLIPDNADFMYVMTHELTESMSWKNSKSIPGQKDYFLEFLESELKTLKAELESIYAFCSMITQLLLPFARKYHDDIKDMKKTLRLFRKNHGGKIKLKETRKPLWLVMFEECSKLQRDFHYIGNVLN